MSLHRPVPKSAVEHDISGASTQLTPQARITYLQQNNQKNSHIQTEKPPVINNCEME